MKAEIRNKPDYASLHLVLDEGEAIVTEAGAMMGMSPDLKLETNLKGGLLGGLKRMVSGESVFLNTYTATADGQRLDVAPAAPGDMLEIELTAERSLTVQRGSYCASTPGVTVDAKWAGAKGFFSGEGLVMLKATGQGTMWISSYGAIDEITVQGSYVVDTTHVVAFEDTLTYTIDKVGGLKSLFLSAEGLVCDFRGHGRLWIQTRSAPALAGFLHPFRRVKPKKND